MTQQYDTIVVGLGGMGSAAAYQLASRGRRVLGLEQFTPAHSQGSSHGKSRIIRQAYFEDPSYVPLLQRAYELWDQIERESGQRLLTPTGGLMIGTADSRTFGGSLRSAQTHGLPHEVLDAGDLRRRYPMLRPDSDTMALYETRAGVLDPEATVWAHLQRAMASGADLRFGQSVTGWEADGDGVRVITAGGTYRAETLVLTPGPWAPQLMADLDLPLTVTRQTFYWFAPIGGGAPFAIGRFPIFIWEVEDGNQIYGFPEQPGQPGVKAAPFYHGPSGDADTIDRLVRDADVDYARALLSRYIPALGGDVVNTATCLYTETPDHHFVLSLHPRHLNVAIASPCSGHGYKFCSVIGEILADLATTGTTGHPIGLFDPARFAARV